MISVMLFHVPICYFLLFSIPLHDCTTCVFLLLLVNNSNFFFITMNKISKTIFIMSVVIPLQEGRSGKWTLIEAQK